LHEEEDLRYKLMRDQYNKGVSAREDSGGLEVSQLKSASGVRKQGTTDPTAPIHPCATIVRALATWHLTA
jgi:hypothetical protein